MNAHDKQWWYGRVLSLSDLPGFAADCKIHRIVFSTREQVRSRRVVTRSRFRPTGKYPSWKMGRMLQWESLNELNAFRLLDCDPKVTAFAEQPCEIVYLDGSATKHHYPNICAEVNRNQELWEIKSESEASESEFLTRTDLLRQGLLQYGFAYRVVLDHELAKQPNLQNAKTLLRFGRRPANDCEREYVRIALKRRGLLSWAETCQGALGTHGREILCRLVLEGVLRFDMDLPLCATTRFLEKEE